MPDDKSPLKATILIADDEDGVRESLADVLRDEGHTVTAVADGTAAIAALDGGDFDLVVSDIRMPGADGLAVQQHAREITPQTLFLFMTAHASVETAVDALRGGAQDYLLKPLLFDDVLHKIEYLLHNRQVAWENQYLRSRVERQWDFDKLVGRSAVMQAVMSLAQRVAPTHSTVLLTGESGVGKEVVARAVHHYSGLRDRIFLPVNCAAIPENLLESQLFGHQRGAFTGAISNQEGMFKRAQGGTIFLDEIGDLAIGLQAKLLRVIEQGEILPVGATTPFHVDVRLIASTNQKLRPAVEEKRFREDLYYRLNVFGIEIPPLRERREDIPSLVDHFIRILNLELKKRFKGATSGTLRLLMSLAWNGNVRELANVIEHAMIIGEGDWIEEAHLPRSVREGSEDATVVGDDLREAMRAYERTHIRGVLAKADPDKRAAADRLGISLSSLYRKIEELGIGLDQESPTETS